MRLVILGGPGAGKGTQAAQLSLKLGIPLISTGEILRTAIACRDSDGECQTELGRQAQAYVERGELVPDEIIIEFIRQRLLQPDVIKGWILEGYPRTAFQAEELDFLLEELNQHLRYALFLDVPEPVMVERSLNRARPDDTPETIQRRLTALQERTLPILEYYEMRDRLLRINGDQAIAEVQQEILQKLQA